MDLKFIGFEEDDSKSYPKEYYTGKTYEDCTLPKEMIDEFIEFVSSLNIEKYIQKINLEKKNIKP